MGQNPISQQDLLVAVRQIENVLAKNTTKNLDFHQRRITNAADSVDASDYTTQGEVSKATALLTVLIKAIQVTLDQAFTFQKGNVLVNRATVTIGAAKLQVITGEGDPEGVVTGPIGSLFLRSDGGAGTSLYVKESGFEKTGWIAK